MYLKFKINSSREKEEKIKNNKEGTKKYKQQKGTKLVSYLWLMVQLLFFKSWNSHFLWTEQNRININVNMGKATTLKWILILMTEKIWLFLGWDGWWCFAYVKPGTVEDYKKTNIFQPHSLLLFAFQRKLEKFLTNLCHSMFWSVTILFHVLFCYNAFCCLHPLVVRSSGF